MSSINLLLNKDSGLSKQKKRLKMARRIAVGCLAIILLTLASIFLLKLNLSSPSTKNDQDALLGQMLSLRKRQAKLTVVKDRINNISAALGKRADTYKIINTLLANIPDAVLVDSLELNDKTVSIKGSSNKIKNISGVFSKTADTYKIINTLLANIPDAVLVDSLELNEGTVSIKASSESLWEVDNFINNLIDMAKRKERIKNLVLNSLDATEAVGGYSFSINAGL